MSNEERAKEEVQKGEAEQMPSGTESSSLNQDGSGKVCCIGRYCLPVLTALHATSDG